MGRGAKVKGWIKNNVTGELRSFQFNPPEHTISRGQTFSEISSPGMSYPGTQWVRGNAIEPSVELYMHDVPFSGRIDSYRSFLGQFMSPEVNQRDYKKPPDMTVCVGSWIRRCVLVAFDERQTLFDGELNVVECTFSLSLRQIGV